MAKRMLVDATHPEETRVVVVNGNRLDELDFEIASRKQLKGNIYLARVIRVEPSLQAAFVEYGGNRHGFLAFSEIHPDYYRIPVADREALLREQQELEEERERQAIERADAEDGSIEEQTADLPLPDDVGGAPPAPIEAGLSDDGTEANGAGADGTDPDSALEGASPLGAAGAETSAEDAAEDAPEEAAAPAKSRRRPRFRHSNGRERRMNAAADTGETIEEEPEDEARPARRRPLRSYKIQEVIKRRQILLVQVTKEERGNKGAALTTYLSLPGRYAVLMPNTPRGGGISRKITNPADRKRLKEMLEEFDIPSGMSVILRTAGIERSKPEIRRDLEYLMRLWDSIRETTLQSVAPALIYEEANLIKRSIRDLYANDIDEIHVEGEDGYRTAKDFMRMLMPSHAKKIQLYKDEGIPLFHRFQVEGAIEAMFNPVVQLKSGGYIVINQTEALVAIDVNSGRSTKERNIEETALKTNLEAADEVARQLRLRDLAGLVVIDFIDMEDGRNNAAVEKRLKEAMKSDRARIQLGRISPFGLLELSRQRLRPSLQEINFERCPHCQGTGLIRSQESAALAVLRAIEEEGIRRRSSEITVTCASSVTLYILNQKREVLADIERRHGLRVYMQADDQLTGPDHRLERIKAKLPGEESAPAPVVAEKVFAMTERQLEQEEAAAEAAEAEAAGEEEAEESANPPAPSAGNGEREGRGRRRRRRRRRGDRPDSRALDPQGEDEGAEGDEDSDETGEMPAAIAAAPGAEDGPAGDEAAEDAAAETADAADDEDSEKRKRRRGKRGGRRRGRGSDEAESTADSLADAAPLTPPLTAVEAAVEQVADSVAAAVEAVVPAEAVTADAAALVEPAVTEDAPAAKKRPSRSRKKAAEPVAAEPVPAVETVAEPAEATPAPKKRASRKKAAEPVAAEVAPEAEAPAAKPSRSKARTKAAAAKAEPVPEAEAAPAPKKRASRKKAAEPAVAEAAPAISETPAEPVANSAPLTGEPTEAAAETESPRRGWWSKRR
ncbi:Rne/Rng family ribonuclease [Oleisolibacter albus]|uniref:Rne/Rng family ribonuclease n=1 Tax=Oleisolibacter albus TaxID=2171757 RepID=UPI000DF2305F|nr:ribonuclease E/G [Oleisolibacter albus]